MERTKRQRKPSRRLEEFEGGSTDYGDGEFALAMALSESSSFAPAAAAVDPPQSANVTQAQLAVAAALPLATPEVDEWVACDANCKNGCGDGPAEPGEWFICREVGLRSAPEGYWRCPTCNGDVAAEKRKMQKVIKNPKVPTYSRIKDTTDSKGVNGNSESKSVTSVYKAQGQPWSSLFKVPKP